MSKFFGYVNDVDSHTKSSQYDLALEKFWVTKCGWIRSRTTVLMGTTINKLLQLCCYGVKRDHYDKLIGIREFLEQLALDLFNNPFSTHTGTPQKNKPLLDDVDDGETVCNCHVIHCYSYTSIYTEVGNIYDLTLNSAFVSDSTLVDSTIECQHTGLKKELGREEGIPGPLEVTLKYGYLMEINAPIEPFGFEFDIIGSTRIPTTVNTLAVTDLQRILTPSFVTIDMLALVVPYLFGILLVFNNDNCLGHNISAMMPLIPIRIYKRHDLSTNIIISLF